MTHIKHLLRDLALAGALIWSLSACGGGGSDSAGGDAAPITSTRLAGHIADAQTGEALAGVAVQVGTLKTTSDANGDYTIDGVSAADNTVVQFSKPLYAANFATVDVASGKLSVANRRLAKVGVTQTIAAQTGGTVTLAGSAAQVQLAASSLVDAASGAAATGNVSVEMTPIDPGVDPLNMPGNYRAQGEAVPIESMGALQVELRDGAGKALNLAPGKQATIRIPVPAGAKSPPLSMPLYYFKESTGLWVREGAATLAGVAPNQYYEGTVSHFTVWNADQPLDTIYINGCVVDAAGKPADASVTSSGLDYYGSATVSTGMPSGQFKVPARRNSRALVTAQAGTAIDAVEAVTGSGDLTLPSCLQLAVKGPTILTQPTSLTVAPGSYAMLDVSAARGLTYQWFRNGVALAEKTRSLFIQGNGAAAGDYYVVISNAGGSVTSATVKVTVASPAAAPAIVSQPADLTVVDGASASFAVTAQGDGLSYQWLRNGVEIGGATGPTLSLGTVGLAQSGGQYTCRVSNNAGNLLSRAALLTVATQTVAPSIAAQPANVSVGVGQRATFTVTAGGTAPFSYQWLLGGVAIANATGASYQTAVTTLADNGARYSVQVTNAKGTVLSTQATLTVSASSSVSGQHLWFPQGPVLNQNVGYGAIPVGGGSAVSLFAAGDGTLSDILVQGTLSNGLVSEVQTRALLFWRSGRLMRQDLTGASGLPAPAVLSTLSNTGLCNGGALGDDQSFAHSGGSFSDGSGTWHIFNRAGADAICGTLDDTFVAVRASQATTDAPRTILRPLAPINNSTTGGLTGWLQRDGQKIVRVDAEFANPVTLFTLPASDLTLAEPSGGLLSNTWLFVSGRKVYAIDITANAPAPLVVADLANTETLNEVLHPDGQSVILAIGNSSATRFVRYTIAGGAVSALGTLPMAGFTPQLTATRIVMSNFSGSIATLPLSGGSAQTIYTPATPGFVLRTQIAGERIWMQAGSAVVSVNSDGSGVQTLAGAKLAGCLYRQNASAWTDQPCDAMLVVADVTVRAYDGVTGALRVSYGSVPSAPQSLTASFGVSPFAYWGQGAVLTEYLTDMATGASTAYNFYFKSDAAGLTLVTLP
ncbi:MAG: hypothetical protein ABIT83_11530 [Massilia sp.]